GRSRSPTPNAWHRRSRTTSRLFPPSPHEAANQGQTTFSRPRARGKWWSVPDLVGWSMTVPVIAIDGPSASGKGTIASRVARQLRFHYLESGALYRLVALLSLREDTLDEGRLAGIAETMDVLFQEGEVVLEDEDVTEKVRSEACANRASEVARMPGV